MHSNVNNSEYISKPSIHPIHGIQRKGLHMRHTQGLSPPGLVKSRVFSWGFQTPIATVAKLPWKEMKCMSLPLH